MGRVRCQHLSEVGVGRCSGLGGSHGGKKLIARLQARSGIAVTVETPAHVERPGLRGEGHPSQIAVATRAAHAFRHMDAVVEIDVIGQARDAGPLQGLVGRSAAHDGLEHRGVGEELGMAVQTGLGRRHSGEGGILHRCMTKPAIDPQLTSVMAMAEENRLIRGKADSIPVRRVIVFVDGHAGRRDGQHAANQDKA